MTEYVNDLVEKLGQWDPMWSYGFLLFSAFLENVIPPVPGDSVVVFSAYLVGRGTLSWGPVYAATCVGGTLGFMVMYYLGLSQGRKALVGSTRRYLSAQNLERAEEWLGRYGSWLILANRFLSGIRSVIAFSAGVGRLEWKSVAILGLVSMAVWNGLLLYAGVLVGQNWEGVVQFLHSYNRVVVGAIILAIGILGLRRWRARRSRKHELPS